MSNPNIITGEEIAEAIHQFEIMHNTDPGERGAKARGCTCMYFANRTRRQACKDNNIFYVDKYCPVHGWATKPDLSIPPEEDEAYLETIYQWIQRRHEQEHDMIKPTHEDSK